MVSDVFDEYCEKHGHTWTCDATGEYWCDMCDETGFECPACNGEAVLDKRSLPNARLVAAAPDLLAALEEIVMLARIGQWYNEDLARDKIGTAKAAIAKANGEGE